MDLTQLTEEIVREERVRLDDVPALDFELAFHLILGTVSEDHDRSSLPLKFLNSGCGIMTEG